MKSRMVELVCAKCARANMCERMKMEEIKFRQELFESMVFDKSRFRCADELVDDEPAEIHHMEVWTALKRVSV